MNASAKYIYMYICIYANRALCSIEFPRREEEEEDEAEYNTGDNVKCALTFACIGQRSVKFKKVETRV